jgi:hypothetical protein
MFDRNDEQHGASANSDELDRHLDAALAKYAAVGPRAGLEDRILVNLRNAQEKGPNLAWWQWGAMAAFAIVLMVGIALGRRPGKPGSDTGRHSPWAPRPDVHQNMQVANGVESSLRPEIPIPARNNGRRLSHSAAAVAQYPKLDRFPSPQPLSEQERILADYVADYPEHAALIAQARTESLRRDRLEQMHEAAGGSRQDLQHQDR